MQSMTEADLRNILEEADFDGPFVDYRAKGNKVEYAGKTTVEGKPAYKIKLTTRRRHQLFFFRCVVVPDPPLPGHAQER